MTMTLLRIRFKANEDDYRPVNWPVKHPYWCTGYGGGDEDGYAIVVSYADDEAYIYENWPEAEDLDVEPVTGYRFSDRFPKPEWWEAPDGAVTIIDGGQ